MKTIRQRLNDLSGFREKMKGNPHEGKMGTLYEWLHQAVDSIEHYGKEMLSNPRGAVKASTFLMRQASMIDELLEPMEQIMKDELTVDDFILARTEMYRTIILKTDLAFCSGMMAENLLEIETRRVQRNILNLLTSK